MNHEKATIQKKKTFERSWNIIQRTYSHDHHEKSISQNNKLDDLEKLNIKQQSHHSGQTLSFIILSIYQKHFTEQHRLHKPHLSSDAPGDGSDLSTSKWDIALSAGSRDSRWKMN
jgi:hypothetical protein